jgi:fructose transport system substrate-binding protein
MNMKKSTTLALTAIAFAASAATSAFAAETVIGLITKTESNPFFVKMKEGAEAEAKKLGAKLLSAAGKQDGDTAAQISAMENMVAAGAKTILITSSGDAIIPTIKKIQAQGVQVIALDSPVGDGTATDALFATDNYKAGVLIGQYTKAALKGKKPVIATMDLFPGHPVGAQRHNGFLKGMGLEALDAKSNELSQPAAVTCMADSYGDASKGQTGMENCLQKNKNINVVYAINEPAAAGAYKALKAAGKANGVIIVGVDGMCSNGVGNVEKGVIAATSMQYPLKMATMGVAAGVQYAKDGKRSSGYTDTGVDLVAAAAMPGVKSIDTKTARGQCWGD